MVSEEEKRLYEYIIEQIREATRELKEDNDKKMK